MSKVDVVGIVRYKSLQHPGFLYSFKGMGPTASNVVQWLQANEHYKEIGNDFPHFYFGFTDPQAQDEFESKYGDLIHNSSKDSDGGDMMCEPRCNYNEYPPCVWCKYQIYSIEEH